MNQTDRIKTHIQKFRINAIRDLWLTKDEILELKEIGKYDC